MGAGTIVLPELQATPIDDIAKKVATAKQAFYEQKTRPVEFRLVQLRKLYWAYVFPFI
jgi:beta-apo-4'-carotenal oxygenase